MSVTLNFLSLKQYLSESSVLPQWLSPLALWLGTKCSFRNTLRCFIYWFEMLGVYFCQINWKENMIMSSSAFHSHWAVLPAQCQDSLVFPHLDWNQSSGIWLLQPALGIPNLGQKDQKQRNTIIQRSLSYLRHHFLLHEITPGVKMGKENQSRTKQNRRGYFTSALSRIAPHCEIVTLT